MGSQDFSWARRLCVAQDRKRRVTILSSLVSANWAGEPEMKLKVCGITEEKNRAEVLSLEPDFIGYIFFAESKRFISQEAVQNFRLPLSKDFKTKAIGVFVDEEVDVVEGTADVLSLWGVQLHGDEDAEYCKYLKQNVPGVALIKVIPIQDKASFDLRKQFGSEVDYFLYETKTSLRGGSGESFDWSLLRFVDHEKPFFISGGIGPANVHAIIAACDGLPLCTIDINSKVESAPGIKSIELVKEVMGKLS